MSVDRRSLMIALLLLAAVAAQGAMWWHVEAAPLVPPPALKSQLSSAIPLKIGSWQGRELEVDAELLYGDDHVKRVYVDPETGESLTLWMAYSRDGQDRGHHPEVCLAVAGLPEDPVGRGTVDLGSDGAPVQQYRYGRTGQFQWIFYWYYTLKTPRDPAMTELQRLYQSMHRRDASVTIEVFAGERTTASRDCAVAFVRQLDAVLQTQLPTGAVRGSRRLPVVRLNQE